MGWLSKALKRGWRKARKAAQQAWEAAKRVVPRVWAVARPVIEAGATLLGVGEPAARFCDAVEEGARAFAEWVDGDVAQAARAFEEHVIDPVCAWLDRWEADFRHRLLVRHQAWAEGFLEWLDRRLARWDVEDLIPVEAPNVSTVAVRRTRSRGVPAPLPNKARSS